MKEVQSVLQSREVEAAAYTGHSFRIGAATTAAARGLPDSLIKTLCRWESAAYMLYIHTPPSALCAVTKHVAKHLVTH